MGVLIIPMVVFMVLVLAGLIYMFRKILTQNVAYATKHLEELSQEYSEKEREISRQFEEAKQQSQDIVLKSRDEAEKLKAQVIKDAEAERDKIIQQARSQSEGMIQDADKARKMLISELEQRIDREAVNRACQLIQNSLPEQFKKDVHSQWTEELIERGFSHLKSLHLPTDINEARIICAFPLTEAQKKKLSKNLKEFIGRDINLKEEVDPKIVAGVSVAIGSLVLDGSLKSRIQERASAINEGGS